MKSFYRRRYQQRGGLLPRLRSFGFLGELTPRQDLLGKVTLP